MDKKAAKPKKKQNKSIIGLIMALAVVLVGSVLFVGAVSGWFAEPKTTIYISENPALIDLSAAEYEELIKNKESFVLLVDQNGCTTADRVREYIQDYININNIGIYKMMFSEMKQSSLNNFVKYYPSVVVVDKGRVRAFLRADSDEDADEYNNYEAFSDWLDRYIEVVENF